MRGQDLIFNGEIVLEGDVLPDRFDDFVDSGYFTPRMVREALALIPGDVTIRVNSSGGSAYEGEAIRAAIEAHSGVVTVVVQGLAASAASLMIMSADRIEMSAGSFLMIHDPSWLTVGDEADHRQSADQLGVLSNGYAKVYAARAGITPEQAREIMRQETWYDAEAAVAAGFADAISGSASTLSDLTAATAADMHHAAIERLRMHSDKFTRMQGAPVSTPTAPAGQQPAALATQTEADMPNTPTPAATTVTPNTAASPQMAVNTPDLDDVRMQAQTAERARARSIREMAAPFMSSNQLTAEQVDGLIEEGVTVESASARMLAVMAASQTPVQPAARATITRDEGETRREGMILAMMGNYDGPGADYRGLRLRSLAMALAGQRQTFSTSDAIRAGMRSTTMMGGAHGVSDFAYITTEVMNRTLIAEYERRGSAWNIVTGAPLTASDFRELHAVRFGGDFQLKDVKENGEYQEAMLNDESEGLKVQRKGRTISLTFEAVINDDMGAFNRIPREFAMAARVMESKMVWELFRKNAVLKSDGKALFHVDHKNLAASGAVISPTSIGAARKAMWEQTAFGSKDPDDFLNLVADRLIVPPALELTAMQFVSGIQPAKTADVNPFTNSVTPYAIPNIGAAAGGSDTAWYLVSSDLPPISVAYLEGYESPTVETIEGMNPDKVTMNARHMFGAAPGEYRGAYKNAGA
ncbi:Clp protease ClpP [Loktanella sp. TSTF-M6]|uniref:Clp protease ClpP n=1 Tax=Loktanella gaetbuli TaxID=2881335 RepID=A0ABS8BU62_9RHOB|nr:head maturation protease, ClpP-related [Loktanella gaetbuli]MCB5199026.1 Clp protease ClpP [Loktanella gaetbuli]